MTRSEAEALLRDIVRAADLPPPRQNARLGRYEADFLWPNHNVAVEVDGYGPHKTRAAFERDRRRNAEIYATTGVHVMQVTWRQLKSEPTAVVARLAAALARGATS